MSRVIRSTIARFTADISDWERNIRRLTGQLNDINIRFGNLGGSITGLAVGFAGLAVAGKIVTSAFEMIGSGMQTVASTGIEFNSQIEQATISFQVLSGSAAVANDIISNLYDYAAKTPFQFPDIIDAGRALEVVGLSAKKNIAWIGDLVAANPQATIQEVARAMARLKSGDFGESFERLRDFGISKDMLLGKGLKFDKSGAYKGSATEALTAVENIVKQKYAGMADAQSKSLKGQISTLRDNINSTFGEVMKPIFDKITNNYLPGIIKRFNDIKNSKFFEWFINGIKLISDSTNAFLIPVINQLGETFARTANYIKTNWNDIALAFKSVELTFRPVLLGFELMTAVTVGSINAMIAGIGSFITTLSNMANTAISAGIAVKNALKFDVKGALESMQAVYSFEQKFAKSALSMMPNALKAYNDGSQSVLKGFKAVKDLIGNFSGEDYFAKYTKPTWVPEITGNNYNTSLNTTADTYDKLTDKIKSFVNSLKSQADAFKNFVGIFDKATTDQPISMDRWLNRLKGQVRALTQYQASIKTLETKANAGVISRGMLADLQALGPAAAKQLQVLAGSTNAKLAQANGLYGQKSGVAGNLALSAVQGQMSAEAKVVQIVNNFNGGAKDEETMQISDKIAGQIIKKLKAAGVY